MARKQTVLQTEAASAISAAAPLVRGRRRDPARDGAILAAAIEVLAEFGYERTTMDLVAERAKAGKATVYRRWPSKVNMILEAISSLKQTQVDFASIPDTGSLRADLLGLFEQQSSEEDERKLRVMAGLASMLSVHPEMAEAGNAVLIQPWVEVNRVLINRAIARGELHPSVDVETAAQIIPSMAAYRALVLRKAFDREFLVSLIDGVLLPMAGKRPPQSVLRRR